MIQPSRPRFRPSPLRHLAVMIAATSLAMAAIPAVPAWAVSNRAHLDRDVLKAMQQGRRMPVILVAHGGLTATHG